MEEICTIKTKLLYDFSDFEDLAVNILECGYKRDAKRTKDIITRELDFMEGYTCIDKAITAKQLKFISHQSVHNIFNHIWRGPWKYEFTFVDFLCCLFPYYLSKLEYRSEKQLRELSELYGEKIYLRNEFTAMFQLSCLKNDQDKDFEMESNEEKKFITFARYAITLNFKTGAGEAF